MCGIMGKQEASYNVGKYNDEISEDEDPEEESCEDEEEDEPSEELEDCNEELKDDEEEEEDEPSEELEDPNEEEQEIEPSEDLEDPNEESKDDQEELSAELLEEDPEEDLEEEDLEDSYEEQTDKPSESISPSFREETLDRFKEKSGYVNNGLDERKKSPGSMGGFGGLQGSQSDNKCGQLVSADQQEDTQSSRKQRRSRWEQLEGDEGTREYNQTGKRRKSRWDIADPQLKLQDSNKLPDFVNKIVAGIDLNPETKELRAELLEINSMLKKPVLLDNRSEEERSPSPEPVYNPLGIRVNTREVRLRQQLSRKRELIVSKLNEILHSWEPSSDCKSLKLIKKLYIPVEQYPGYNFIGLIMGPQGNTKKKMEKETGTTIKLRGKGSSLKERDFSEDENLHVRIEADSQASLDAAAKMVEKLLIPIDDQFNTMKRSQLEELARLRSTYKDSCKDSGSCSVCGSKAQLQYACPCLISTFGVSESCITCGSNNHLTASCPLTLSSNHKNSQNLSLAMGLGLGLGPGPSLTPNTQSKPKDEINDKNLYVGYLPKGVDDNRLKVLFTPFGNITTAIVIKDRTTGLSKGYGFVNFESSVDAAAAVKHMDKYQLDGNMLAVRLKGIKPVIGTPVVNPLPQYHVPTVVPTYGQNQIAPAPYHVPAAVPAYGQSQIAVPGPQNSWPSENKISVAQNNNVKLYSSSVPLHSQSHTAPTQYHVPAAVPSYGQSQIAAPGPQKSRLPENNIPLAHNKVESYPSSVPIHSQSHIAPTQYHASAAVPSYVQSQIAAPGPQKSWLPENSIPLVQNNNVKLYSSSVPLPLHSHSQIACIDPQNSSGLPVSQIPFAQNKNFELFSSSSYTGHNNLISKGEGIFITHSGNSQLDGTSSFAAFPQNVQSKVAWPSGDKSLLPENHIPFTKYEDVSLPRNVQNQTGWLACQNPWQPESQVSFAQNKNLGLESSSSGSVYINLPFKSEDVVSIPPSQTASLYNTNNNSSFLSLSSTKSIATFPGDPDYKLPSYF